MTISILPETAPFSPAQRAWLNGFFAGMLGVESTTASETAGSVSALTDGLPGGGSTQPVEEDFPWHDPTMTMEERLPLSVGKPLKRVLMSAMAQQDCGQCGYLCQTYAEAIADGSETSLKKCAPGGKETANKLKQILAAEAIAPRVSATKTAAPAIEPVVNGTAVNSTPLQSLNDFFPARLLQSSVLNKPGSEKETRFVSFDLTGSGISYQAGDSLGVYAENCPELVEAIIVALNASGEEQVPAADGRALSLRDALSRECDLNRPADNLLSLLASSARETKEADVLETLLDDCGNRDILDLLKEFPSARPAQRAFVRALDALQPRLYSISSSQKAHPNEVHLTVATVRYRLNDRARKGVASTFLAERVGEDHPVRLFVQTAHGFRLPPQMDTPIIMVGPGTGVAPFRAFLEERKALGATGKNWLFFGDQRSACDFLYKGEFEGYVRDGLLTRLSAAFSRDQKEKIYVQHHMLENAKDIWAWLQEGAYFYVCGDAKRMARDVDQALQAIVAEQGKMTADEAKAYVAKLTKSKRYLRDVY